jgi:hypothetical protein
MARSRSRAPRAVRRHPAHPTPATERRYRNRGVEVAVRESHLGLGGLRRADKRVDLTLDGVSVDVEMVDGRYHCQLANQFTSFETIDEVVDALLDTEGRTWTLHGHVCDDRCGDGHHHGPGDHEPGHDGGHVHGARAARYRRPAARKGGVG